MNKLFLSVIAGVLLSTGFLVGSAVEAQSSGLLSRISSDITAHSFSSAMQLWSTGDIQKSDIVSAFNLNAAEQADLNKLETFYNTLTTAQKAAFKARLESVLILREEGYITDQQAINLLGLN